jgi:hypothetical protein
MFDDLNTLAMFKFAEEVRKVTGESGGGGLLLSM